MYTKILVPLDGSPLSERILPYARNVARALPAPAELIHVIHPHTIETLVDVQRGRFGDIVRSDLEKTSQEYLERLAQSFFEASKTRCSVEVGPPAETILRRAREDAGILVAMSTRGYSGVKSWLLGSVATKIMQRIRNPLLLIKSSGETPKDAEILTRLLAPLDGSELAEMVLPHVAAIAKALALSVELLHAYSPPLSALVPVDYQMRPEEFPGTAMRQALHKKAEEYLQGKVEQLRATGLKNVTFSTFEGDAAHGIIETARTTRSDLIVMCTHGRSGVGEWLLGSTTERVLAHSEDPILVIPAAPHGS